MDDRSGKVEKTRVSVTLTRPYVEALNHLIEEGIYLSKGESSWRRSEASSKATT